MHAFPVTTSPPRDEFLCTARRGFGFLVSEFGFTEQPDSREHVNPFSVHYRSTEAAVVVDGIQWGFGVQILLSCLSPAEGFPSFVPLWAIVELRAPQERRSVSGQLAQLALNASLLRLYAADILRGDFKIFPAAMRLVEHHAAEAGKPKQRKLP